MNFVFTGEDSFLEFIERNEDYFLESLIAGSDELAQNIGSNPLLDKDYLLATAKNIVQDLSTRNIANLKKLAVERGRNIAETDVPLYHALDFFAVCRRTYWTFFNHYTEVVKNEEVNGDDEIEINFLFDHVINEYVRSFTNRKNEIIDAQRITIEELTTPIIPLTDSIAILPMIGTIDTTRAKKIRQDALRDVENLRIRKLIVDFSGVDYMDTFVVQHLFNIVSGLKLIGCKTIVTGVKAEIANTMVEMNVDLEGLDMQGELKQALEHLYN